MALTILETEICLLADYVYRDIDKKRMGTFVVTKGRKGAATFDKAEAESVCATVEKLLRAVGRPMEELHFHR